MIILTQYQAITQAISIIFYIFEMKPLKYVLINTGVRLYGHATLCLAIYSLSFIDFFIILT